MSVTKTAVIADDHAVFRMGTRQILSTFPDVEVLAEAENGIEAIAAVKKHKPDLLVLDAAMPLCRGLEVYTDSRRWSPETKICLLTGFTSVGLLSQWMSAGVDGILLKTCAEEEMRQGFEVVLTGGAFVCQLARDTMAGSTEPQNLTARELEVLSLIVTGASNADISDRLSISIKTVSKHRGSLMGKLGVHSVAELMAYALREGLLDELKQL